MMVYLLNGNKLPWTDFKEKFSDQNFSFNEFLQERSKVKYMLELIQMAPPSMSNMLRRLLQLEFTEEPPYDELISLLVSNICQDVRLGPDLQPLLH